MNAAHLHLLINHLPIIGACLSIPLVALALWRRTDRGLLLAATVILALSAAGALASMRTGESAEEVAEHLPGVSEALIEEHEERAELATPFAVVTALGAIAIFGLASRRNGEVAPVWLTALLIANTATAGAMAWTGAAGGVIRHSEIRGNGASATALMHTDHLDNEGDDDDDDDGEDLDPFDDAIALPGGDTLSFEEFLNQGHELTFGEHVEVWRDVRDFDQMTRAGDLATANMSDLRKGATLS